MQCLSRVNRVYAPSAFALVLCVLAASVSRTCVAVLGETELELRIRYGDAEALKKSDRPGFEKSLHFPSSVKGPNGIVADVYADLVDGKCVSISYAFYQGANLDRVAIDGEEAYGFAKQLVMANGQGHNWKGRPGPPPEGMNILWIRSDNPRTRAAVWANLPHILEIVTAEADAAMERAGL